MGLTLKQAANSLIKLHPVSTSVLMKSMPGVGKSSMEEAVAAALSVLYDEPFGNIIFMLSLIDSVEFGGFMHPMDDPRGGVQKLSAFSLPPVMPHWVNFQQTGGAYQIYHKGKQIITNDGENYVYTDGTVVDDLPEWWDGVPRLGIVFLDEWGQAAPDVQKAAADLWLNRRIRGVPLPKGWQVLGATNREEDQSGVNREFAFNINRRTEIPIDFSLSCWQEWGNKNGVAPLIRSFVGFKKGGVFVSAVPEEPQPFCTPRSIVEAGKTLTALATEEEKAAHLLPTTEEAYAFCSGWIGKAQTDELWHYATMASELWTAEEILNEPKKAPIYSDRPDALYVVVNALSETVDKSTADALYTYMQRLPRDWQVHLIRTAIDTTPMVVAQKDFAKWMNDNRNLIAAAQA